MKWYVLCIYMAFSHRSLSKMWKEEKLLASIVSLLLLPKYFLFWKKDDLKCFLVVLILSCLHKIWNMHLLYWDKFFSSVHLPPDKAMKKNIDKD